MAYDVSSEWDDIHRRLGNYEPVRPVTPEAEHTKAAVERLEGLAEGTSGSEDEFEREYLRQRATELAAPPRFGRVVEVSAAEYVREVSEAGTDVTVLLSLYEEGVLASLRVNAVFEQLCAEFPQVKFVKAVASRCVAGFPAAGLPCVLHYRAGALLRTFSPPDFVALPALTPSALRLLFASALPTTPTEENARQLRNRLLGRPPRPREECDSDEEEREDRQFSSNKVRLRY